MATISAHLVRLYGKGIAEKKSPVKSWKVIKDTDFEKGKPPELFRLGRLQISGDDRFWSVSTHFYNNIICEENVAYKDSVVAVAFRVNNSTISDTVSDCDQDIVSVYIDKPDSDDEQLEELDKDLQFDGIGADDKEIIQSHKDSWYVMPYKKTVSNYVTAVGCTKLSFCNIAGETIISASLYTDTTPDIDRQEYDQLIEDLINIYDYSVCSDISSQTLSIDRRPMVALFKDNLKKLECLLDRIDNLPEKELIGKEKLVPVRKLRRITFKTLQDISFNRGGRVHSEVREETVDIYEHRMIRRYLDSVADVSQRFSKMIPVDSSTSHNVTGSSKFEKLEKEFLNKLPGCISRAENAKSDNMKKLKAGITPETAKNPIAGRNDNGISGAFIISEGENDYLKGNVSFDFDGQSCDYETMYKITFMVHGDNDLYALFFVYALNEIRNKSVKTNVTLEGYTDVRNVDLIKIPGSKRAKDGRIFPIRVDIAFKMLKRVIYELAGEQKELVFERFLEKLKDKDYDTVRKASEIYVKLRISRAAQSEYYIARQKERLRKEKDDWEQVSLYAKRLRDTYRFLNVPETGEKMHPTNLFLKGYNYRDVYSILTNSLSGYTPLTVGEGKKIRILAAQNLYERWALYKMLSLLERIGFCQTDGKKITESIRDYFSDPARKSGPQFFRMKKEIHEGTFVCIDIIYQQIVSKGKPVGKDKSYKEPDFMFIVWMMGRTESDKKKIFILDTKYRDFGEQSVKEWYDLLSGVAYKKYICDIYEGWSSRDSSGKEFDINKAENFINTNYRLCGSYIIHSDVRTDKYFEIENGKSKYRVNLTNYYGQMLPDIRRHFSKCKENAPLLHRSCMTGAVAMMPQHTEYFMNLFRMMMEHFFGVDETVCWNCGSSDIEIMPSASINGKASVGTALRCRNCDEFWVVTVCDRCKIKSLYGGELKTPIRKHVLNYYFERPGANGKRTWMVICPECNSDGPKGL